MNYSGYNVSLLKVWSLVAYRLFAKWLPASTARFVGPACKAFRYHFCRRIFASCGKNVNIERNANFGCGFGVSIGDNSGIGINCSVPNDIVIGANVMMGPECTILALNHRFDRVDVPMCQQGSQEPRRTVIGDDVWIGREVLMTPGRNVARGTVIAARCLLCKDFPEYSVVGGNPSVLIKSRI